MTKKLDEATKLANKQKREEAKLIAKNKAFNKLSKPQKRVEIAKDVIAQIKAEKFKPKNGVYYKGENFKKFKKIDSVQKILLLPEAPKCSVCGIGAVMLSTVKKCNDLSTTKLLGYWDNFQADALSKTVASKFFSEKQLDLIEACFERTTEYGKEGNLLDWFGNRTPATVNAIDFGNKYRYPTQRLLAIMENIIANNGTFKP